MFASELAEITDEKASDFREKVSKMNTAMKITKMFEYGLIVIGAFLLGVVLLLPCFDNDKKGQENGTKNEEKDEKHPLIDSSRNTFANQSTWNTLLLLDPRTVLKVLVKWTKIGIALGSGPPGSENVDNTYS